MLLSCLFTISGNFRYSSNQLFPLNNKRHKELLKVPPKHKNSILNFNIQHAFSGSPRERWFQALIFRLVISVIRSWIWRDEVTMTIWTREGRPAPPVQVSTAQTISHKCGCFPNIWHLNHWFGVLHRFSFSLIFLSLKLPISSVEFSKPS